MSFELRLLSDTLSPAIAGDIIRQRNTAFLKGNPFLTPSRLYGHRLAAIFAALVAFLWRETKPRASRIHALRVLHYAELLRQEMVIYEEYRPLASLSFEGSYMRLRNRMREAEALDVDDDIEIRARIFEGVVFGITETYVVEETAWTAGVKLGELQWWRLLSNDAQIAEEHIQRLSRGGNELREPTYPAMGVAGTCHTGTSESSTSSSEEALECILNSELMLVVGASDLLHHDAAQEARLNRLMSFAKQEPPQVRVPSWSADSGSPEQSREPTAAASTHEESAYRHASHPFLVTTHQSYVDRIMEAIEGVPQSRRIPSSEDRGEGVPAEAGTTSLFLAIPRIRTRINPIQSFPHTTEDTTGQFFLPVEHVGFSSDTSCRPPPAAKADRTIERNVANTYHKYSLPSKNGASASMHDGPHRAQNVWVRLRDVGTAQYSPPERGGAPLSRDSLVDLERSSNIREGQDWCQNMRSDMEELASSDVWHVKRNRTDERITELGNVLATTMHNAQVVYQGLREAKAAAHHVASLAENLTPDAIELQGGWRETTDSPAPATDIAPALEVPSMAVHLGKRVNGCTPDTSDPTAEGAAISTASRLRADFQTHPAPAPLALDPPPTSRRQSSLRPVQAGALGSPVNTLPI